MRREQTLEEISDGRLYDSNDMVKADCHDCEGCCDCCQGMGDSVILDPFDVHRLSTGLKKPVEQLLQECLEFGVSDGQHPSAPSHDRSKGTVRISQQRRTLQHPCYKTGILQTVSTGKIL